MFRVSRHLHRSHLYRSSPVVRQESVRPTAASTSSSSPAADDDAKQQRTGQDSASSIDLKNLPPFRRNVMLLGPPGVGKGTYASGASKILGVPHLAAGDVIRKEIKEDTPLGKKMKDYSSKGELVPDDLVMDMMIEAVQRHGNSGVLLDGFPRTLVQAEKFQSSGVRLDAVINLQQSEDIIFTKITSRRVCSNCGEVYNLAHIKKDGINMPPMLPKVEGICDTCGAKDSLVQRKDDEEATVRHRLQVYAEETRPLVEFYRRLGILKDFFVSGGAEELLPSFVSILYSSKEKRD